MTARMTVDGRVVPIGLVALHFQYFLDDGPPHAWIDVSSDSDNERLGGIAINCLDVGDHPTLASLYGRTLSFGSTDDGDHGELSESLFWLPGDETLEIQSLRITFGHAFDGALPVEVDATCFDHVGSRGIAVRVEARADIDAL